MVGFSQVERELLRFIQDCDGSVSKEELVSEGPTSEERVNELLLGLEDYLELDVVEESGNPVRMYEVDNSIPECYSCGRLLAFEEVEEFEGDVFCVRHYMDRVREAKEERRREHRKRRDQMIEERREMREELGERRSDLDLKGSEGERDN